MGKVLLQSGEATKGVDAKTPRCIDAKSVTEINFVNSGDKHESIVGWGCYPNNEKSTQSYPSPEFLNSLSFIKKFYPAPLWGEGKLIKVTHDNSCNSRHSEVRQNRKNPADYISNSKGIHMKNFSETDQASMPLGIFASKLVSLLGWKAQPTSNVGGVGTPPYVAIRFWGQTDWWGRGELTGNNITENTPNAGGYGCSKDNKYGYYSGFYCGALILFDGWKISDDYPW